MLVGIAFHMTETLDPFDKVMTNEVNVIHRVDDCTLPLKDKKSLKVAIHEIYILANFLV